MEVATAEHIQRLGLEWLPPLAPSTQQLWAGGAELPDYLEQLRAQLDRSAGRAELWGVVRNGQLLASLKRYALMLSLGGRPLAAIGIGAVFTQPEQRGRGLAGRLIRQLLLAAQQQGVHGALLFSDIDPAFYQRLGFAAFPALSWCGSQQALERAGATELSWHSQPLDAALFNRLRREGSRADELMLARDAQDWSYWSWRGGEHTWWRLQHARGEVLGYLGCTLRGEHLVVNELVTRDVSRQALHGSLGQLAVQQGARTVSGWLRPEHAGGPFVVSVRRRCVPMISWLSDPPPVYAAARFSVLDSF